MPNLIHLREDLIAHVERLQRELDRLRDVVTDLDPSGDRQQVSAGRIRAVLKARALREEVFGRETVADAGWDILLELYARHLEGETATITSVSRAAAIPNTTTLRWIGQLQEAGLIDRTADVDDKRRVLLRLTSRGVAAMKQYFGSEKTAALIV